VTATQNATVALVRNRPLKPVNPIESPMMLTAKAKTRPPARYHFSLRAMGAPIFFA
jgi:hypothetical protein